MQRSSTLRLGLAFLAAASLSAGCGTSAGSPPSLKSVSTAKATATGTPSGWKTVVFGGLEVSVPASWSVASPVVNENVCLPKPDSVTPMSFNKQVSTSCPSAPPPLASNVAIGCDYGAALDPYRSPNSTATTNVEGRVLRWSQSGTDYVLTMTSGSGLAFVQVIATAADAGAIFRSVRPSTSHC